MTINRQSSIGTSSILPLRSRDVPANTVSPVSYTHLDVYKRQLLVLYLQKRGKRLWIILVGQQAFQSHGVLAEVPFHIPVQPFYQLPVTVEKPSAEGDAVGLVVEFLRINIVKRLQLRVLQDLCVQLRHSVDCLLYTSFPRSPIPSTSVRQFILLAVYIPEQEPQVGQV